LQHVLGKQRELPAGEDEDELPQVRKWGASRNDSSRWHNTPTEHGVEGAGLHSVRDGTLPTDENAELLRGKIYNDHIQQGGGTGKQGQEHVVEGDLLRMP
jgi:hypothetical protein